MAVVCLNSAFNNSNDDPRFKSITLDFPPQLKHISVEVSDALGLKRYMPILACRIVCSHWALLERLATRFERGRKNRELKGD
jgi:hypothetical protein